MVKKKADKIINKIFLFFVIITFFVIALIVGVLEIFYHQLPSLKPLDPTDNENISYWGIPSKVYSAEGVLFAEFYKEKREIISYKDIPKDIINAIIAIEDKDFFKHRGINFKGIMRASFINIIKGFGTQGGSSLTQQLAKALFLSPKKEISRKIKEALLAIKIEMELTKDEILERYFNKIYFGHNAYGLEAAANVYFGKSAKELTLGECAMLAGLPKAPNRYSPLKNPVEARNRQLLVLNEMVKDGYITEKQKEAAIKEFWDNYNSTKRKEIESNFRVRSHKAGHFVDYIKKQLLRDYNVDLVFNGGLKIYTTINIKYQQVAEEVISEHLKNINATARKTGIYKDQKIEGALIALNTRNGDILAMVGGSEWTVDNQLNRAVQSLRQPGSSFKPFVYLTAFEAGYSQASIVLDAPVYFEGANNKLWVPTNYDENYLGPITIRTALIKSQNIPAIRIADKVGIRNVINTAKRLGIKSPLQPYLPTAIGATDVRIIEMANAFMCFANGGYYYNVNGINKILDRKDNEIYRKTISGNRVVLPEYAYVMTDVLQGVTQPGGTASKISSIITRPVAGKTGTTNNYRDAWFIGYTPSVVIAVWIGYDKGELTLQKGQTGGGVAAPIFAEFVKKAMEDEPIEKFEPPSGIVFKNVCKTTGKLATENCPIISMAFVKGTEPKDYCAEH
ncbi:MAG TPA: penicillin-binding protein 1A [bacterium]|nr:penicillin-binding protein 1A [bacterium]HOL48241.1 penicillin-binding protein 1A [bacterium]HPQ18137.1 penicillin-binding protein 1A [bacterium]